jgi:hypothetical protein
VTRALAALVAILALVATKARAADDCLDYEPAVVELTGKLVAENENSYTLLPDHPICLHGTSGNGLNQGLSGVSRLQIALADGSRPPDKLLGARVTARGSLFGSRSGGRDGLVLIAESVRRAP